MFACLQLRADRTHTCLVVSPTTHQLQHALATVQLAQIQQRLGEPDEAIALITPALPLLLEHCPLSAQAQAHAALGRSYLSLAAGLRHRGGQGGGQGGGGGQVFQSLQTGVGVLEKALQAYIHLQMAGKAQEVAYLLARAYHALHRRT
eukprot:SAG22_NODE_7333_length_750_cov_1.414747_1_plen_147_part_10